MATLATLRRRVLIKLGDFQQTRALEADHYLNLAQDQFTRETEQVQLLSVQDIVAGQAAYTLTPAAGYLVAKVLRVTYFDGSRDYPLGGTTFTELEAVDPDWRNATGTRPEQYVRNLNLVTEETVAGDLILLTPPPSANVADGLRVIYAAMTDTAMTADDSTTLLPKYDDAMVDFALAEMKHPDAAAHMQAFVAAIANARAEAERGFEDQPRRVRAWRG